MINARDELQVIQEDIRRALRKPNPQWAMLIDLRRCVGCKACTVGCMAEQKTPPGVFYRPVYEEETGQFPNVRRGFTPRPCMRCDNPPCVAACPNKGENGATWKSRDGIVMINYEQCIGTRRARWTAYHPPAFAVYHFAADGEHCRRTDMPKGTGGYPNRLRPVSHHKGTQTGWQAWRE